ncbi:piggyBac transposable element-derived protein 4-like [Centruroides vittatus]|uniref:piggyBac transposable element-derived protein 4-like n=1 Tax=Centruroides vittatus TaxID=120091 RepID=UPI00350F7509
MATKNKKLKESEMSDYLDHSYDSLFEESESDLNDVDISDMESEYFDDLQSFAANPEEFAIDLEESADDPDTFDLLGPEQRRHGQERRQHGPEPALIRFFSNSDDAPNSDDELEDEYHEVLQPEQSLPDPFPFLELPGPKNMPSADSQPIDYFNLFFTVSLLSLMVAESNKYAKQVINGIGGEVPPYLQKFKKITINEIKGFLAVVFSMGLVKKSKIAKYWATSGCTVTPWYGQMFSKHRFCHLLRFFHLVDNSKLPGRGEPGYDPRAKYQPLEDHANRVFRHHYTPHQGISVDETLVDTKNRTSILQYMPNKKHHKWGIKLWMLCDSISHYCLGFFTYRGAKSQAEKHSVSKFGVAYSVVMKLLEIGNYINKGYHVFVDNYFMSVPLVCSLYSLKTYTTGTVRRNRKLLPPQLKGKFDVGQISYCRSGPILACGLRERKTKIDPVILLSSHARARDVEIVRRGVAKSKPQIVNSYNKFMGGVDVSDMMMYAYLDERRTVKYWKKIGIQQHPGHDVECYLLYKENSQSQGPAKIMCRLDFNEAVIERLAGQWMEERRKELREVVRPLKTPKDK